MELGNGRKVVVTGGAGFIGSHVVDRLVAIGAEVVALDDLSVGREENLASATDAGAKLVVGSVLDESTLARELTGADAVIHMACDNLRASLVDPIRSHEVNAKGSLLTALASVEAKVGRFVYVSSSEAYGSAVTLPMSEDHPLLPTTVYGAAKAAGELYAQACMRTYGLPVTVVRPFNSYGPREHSSGTSAEVIPKFVSRLSEGMAPIVFGDGAQTRDFTWVEETAMGIVDAAAADDLVGEAVNIASGKQTSILEIARLALEAFERSPDDVEFDQARPGDVDHHQADVTKARERCGFETTIPIREGLVRYVGWVRSGAHPETRGEPEVVRNWE